MNEQVREYIEKYSNEIIDMFGTLRKLIFDNASSKPQEIMWAMLQIYLKQDIPVDVLRRMFRETLT